MRGARLSLSEHTTGWKVLVGARPWRYFGAEAEYVDFGRSGVIAVAEGAGPTFPAVHLSGAIHPTAAAAFVVDYMPTLPPYLDLFAKPGASDLKFPLNFSGVWGFIGLLGIASAMGWRKRCDWPSDRDRSRECS